MPDDAHDFHEEFCANKNVVSALIFVAGSAFMLAGCLNGIKHSNRIDSNAFGLFLQVFLVVFYAYLFIAFKCARERIVLAVSAITGLPGLVFALAPVKSQPYVVPFRFTELGLWLLALAVSFSMLVSAFRKQKALRAMKSS